MKRGVPLVTLGAAVASAVVAAAVVGAVGAWRGPSGARRRTTLLVAGAVAVALSLGSLIGACSPGLTGHTAS